MALYNYISKLVKLHNTTKKNVYIKLNHFEKFGWNKEKKTDFVRMNFFLKGQMMINNVHVEEKN